MDVLMVVLGGFVLLSLVFSMLSASRLAKAEGSVIGRLSLWFGVNCGLAVLLSLLYFLASWWPVETCFGPAVDCMAVTVLQEIIDGRWQYIGMAVAFALLGGGFFWLASHHLDGTFRPGSLFRSGQSG